MGIKNGLTRVLKENPDCLPPIYKLQEIRYGIFIEFVCGDFAFPFFQIVTTIEDLENLCDEKNGTGFGLIFFAMADQLEQLELKYNPNKKNNGRVQLIEEEAFLFLQIASEEEE